MTSVATNPPSTTAASSLSPNGATSSSSHDPHALTWRDDLPYNLAHYMRRLEAIMESDVVTVVIATVTLVALFIDDLRVWLFDANHDSAIFTITLIIFCLLASELIIYSIVKPSYFLGFFFWLDIVAAFSLLPDIPLMWYPMLGLRESDAQHMASVGQLDRINSVSDKMIEIQRAIRFIRLIRLVRIAKLFELFHRKVEIENKKKKLKRMTDIDPNAAPSNQVEQEELNKPSQVGQHLSEQTTRKVVLLVLLMLFGIPLLQPQLEQHGEQYTLQELNMLANSNVTLDTYSGSVKQDSSNGIVTSPSDLTPEATQLINKTMSTEIEWVLSYYRDSCLFLNVQGNYYQYTWENNDVLGQHRIAEVKSIREGLSVALFSTRSTTRIAAEYSVLTTLVVLGLLSIGAILFNRNNHRMVIVPIERMMATIVALQQNPLAKASLSTLENDRDHNNETGMLERTLEKLTGLLQVGFGEAGSKMIQKCMNLNAEGDLDPLVDGTKMLAIFGFCDIRRFTDATECLKEDVMMYVNEIAAIVHSNVALCDGNPNKNIGDAFLIVWRLPGDRMDGDDLFLFNECQPISTRPQLSTMRKRLIMNAVDSQATDSEKQAEAELTRREQYDAMLNRAKKAGATCPPVPRPISSMLRQQVSMLADKAIVSFLRIIVEISASDEVKKYANHPRIRAAFQEDFEVQLGFGLHCGWAIEGPIGSRYKIDASYLSPHVNLAETLQDATKIYGTPLLFSGEFYSLLSPYMKSHCRRLDVVRVSGRESPMNLYSFDIHPHALTSIIELQAPMGYEQDDSITVVEVRSKNSSAAFPMSPDSELASEQELLRNTFLNANTTDFSCFAFNAADRSNIQASSPIASYHTLRNFRLSALQAGIPKEFFDGYAVGLEQYLEGDWTAAQSTLEDASKLYPQDVATKVLLDVMREHQFIAPQSWNGCHDV